MQSIVLVSSLGVGRYKTSLVVEVGERVAVVSAGTESDGFRFLVRCRRCGAGVSTGTTPHPDRDTPTLSHDGSSLSFQSKSESLEY